ncbi:MAG: hypothetical protein M1306_02980 [Candidatus Thermoplasmatota archaeon]|nr:hypothetical protein [Candidatus Thermoplasmatota archaeon]
MRSSWTGKSLRKRTTGEKEDCPYQTPNAFITFTERLTVMLIIPIKPL